MKPYTQISTWNSKKQIKFDDHPISICIYRSGLNLRIDLAEDEAEELILALQKQVKECAEIEAAEGVQS